MVSSFGGLTPKIFDFDSFSYIGTLEGHDVYANGCCALPNGNIFSVSEDQLNKNMLHIKNQIKKLEKDVESFGKLAKNDKEDKFSEVMKGID